MITRANGSLSPDASEPIKDRAWYMCARTWKNCNQTSICECQISENLIMQYVFLSIVDRDWRRQTGPLSVQKFIGDLKSWWQARGVALLVFDRTQPEINLQLCLNHPTARTRASFSGKLKVNKRQGSYFKSKIFMPKIKEGDFSRESLERTHDAVMHFFKLL